MQRITTTILLERVKRLNDLTDSPTDPWKNVNGENVAQIGNYHLSFEYDGVSLYRILCTQGSIEDIFRSGHMPKRELSNRICAFMDGIRSVEKVPQS